MEEYIKIDENLEEKYKKEVALATVLATKDVIRKVTEELNKKIIKKVAINLYKNDVSKDIIIKSLNISQKQLNEYLK